jgi:hypothetical protein
MIMELQQIPDSTPRTWPLNMAYCSLWRADPFARPTNGFASKIDSLDLTTREGDDTFVVADADQQIEKAAVTVASDDHGLRL